MLSGTQIERFVSDGFVRVDEAFPRDLADRCRDLLWTKVGCVRDDPSTWTKPVVWLTNCDERPFVQAANTTRLHRAMDQLVGPGRWIPRSSLGAFPVRFPASEDTGDTGWHVDVSFPGAGSDPNDYQTWHVNVRSRGRALLMLFLFSDVGEHDAPTRIRVGSHRIVARLLEPVGEPGLRGPRIDLAPTAGCAEALATGPAGTVYLCHPFLVHAAQINRGSQPRFLAQPCLFWRGGPDASAPADGCRAPVEEAIQSGLTANPR
ncbi:MAG TPA: phytanoyl-CoA dioxygenase [Pseudomonadales bacterium]